MGFNDMQEKKALKRESTRLTNFAIKFIWKGVGGMNPAVGIHNVATNAGVNNTVYWVTNILSWRNQEGKGNEHNNSAFVVQSEHIVVDADTVKLHKSFDRSEHIKHDAVLFLNTVQ